MPRAQSPPSHSAGTRASRYEPGRAASDSIWSGEPRRAYREALRRLPRGEWAAYLDRHSGLPGPRVNLALLQAAGDEGNAAWFTQLTGSPDEFRAATGAAGLGRVLAERPDEPVVKQLHELAADPRWRSKCVPRSPIAWPPVPRRGARTKRSECYARHSATAGASPWRRIRAPAYRCSIPSKRIRIPMSHGSSVRTERRQGSSRCSTPNVTAEIAARRPNQWVGRTRSAARHRAH